MRVVPEAIKPITDEIPEQARPSPMSGVIIDEPYIVKENPWFSNCITSSIHRLKKNLPPGRELTAADIFADIAKKGSGTSVQLLRDYNIGPNEIQGIIDKKNLDVIRT